MNPTNSEIPDEFEDVLNDYLGNSSTRRDLCNFVADAYSDDDINFEKAVYGFTDSNIEIEDKFVDPVTGRENKRRDELNRALRKVLEDETTAYSKKIGANAAFGINDFADKVWTSYCSNRPETEVEQVKSTLLDWASGNYGQIQNLEHPISDFSSFQKEALKDAYGKDAELPVLRGKGFKSIARYSPDIQIDAQDSYTEVREAILEHIESENGIRIERPLRDSWSDSPHTANEFAAHWPEGDSGLVLGNRVNPQDITFSSITTPFLNSESEYILEDDSEWFDAEDIFITHKENGQDVTDQILWQIENLQVE